MSKDLNELKKAYERLPEGMEDWIDLYREGKVVASVYKSHRSFDDVFSIEDQYPFVWWVTAECAIVFDHWEENDL